MQQKIATPIDLKVLMNHIYEYQKGVRRMVLFTFNKKYEAFARTRLERQHIEYVIQPVGNDRLNLFFGKRECLDAIRMIVTKPLCQLSPEEDFILGAMLGYDICAQCERFCEQEEDLLTSPIAFSHRKGVFLFTGDDSFLLMAPFSA